MEPRWLSASRDAFAGEPEPVQKRACIKFDLAVLIGFSCIFAYGGFILWGLG